MWMEVHIYSVKAKSQAGNIWVKDIMTAAGDQKIYVFCQKIQQERVLLGLISIYENTPEKLLHLPPKSIWHFT